ncbi:protein phosphatase methylesterase 1 [Palaemon carinicauda]|uniref:protein phosphatase methylesterase 1 n=1 Tax=Palaemon carinicauda TaxID=392227 RepID=UPI0035B5FA28
MTEQADLRKSLMKNRLPPMGPPGLPVMGRGIRGRGSGGSMGARRDYNPVSWNQYWDTCEAVKIDSDDVFQVYRRGTSGPLLLLLHGGGYSALTWSLFAESVSEMVECQVMAFDQRGHGDTRTVNDCDLSADTLVGDVGRVLEAVYGMRQPTCIIIGHSMGGAIAVHTAYNNNVAGLAAIVVIDVVEGTAMDNLSSMQTFLRSRPQSFNSLQNAIEWSVRSGQTRNAAAARVSMPGQVKNIKTGMCGTTDIEASKNEKTENIDMKSNMHVRADVIPEEGVENSGGQGQESPLPAANQTSTPNTSRSLPVKRYTWRINLAATEKYWSGWFEGLSARFLDCSPAKMLLLAGIDRLDTDLTVGQMQGKFQMQVLPQCGHAVQEDTPDRLAEVIATFLLRHRLSSPKADFQRSFPAC